MDALLALLPPQYLVYVPIAVAVCSAICALTPTPDPSTPWGRVYKLLEFVALNFGRAKQTGKAVPSSPPPSGQSGSGTLALVLLLGLALGAGGGAGGCAMKNLTGPENARIVAWQMLDAYEAAYAQYGQHKDSLTTEQRVEVARALNLAKPIVVALASAANIWSAAAANSTDSAAARAKYASILTDAQAAMTQVANLIAKIQQGGE